MVAVPYTVMERRREAAAPCAACGRSRPSKLVLMPDPHPLGSPNFDAAESLSLCEDCAPEDWTPARHVTDQELANLRSGAL